jgi:hypothetical protein
MTEELWIEGPDDLALAGRGRHGCTADSARHIGCPLSWFVLVFPVMRGKNELAVALYLYRLRTIQRSRTVRVSNMRLLTELGIDRYAKYRALRRLAAAGIITLERRRSRSSLEVTFRQKRRRRLPKNL